MDDGAREPAREAARLAGRVVARLERIEALRGGPDGGGRAPELLAELRALVPEAEAWARSEGAARARGAGTKLRAEVEGMR